MTKHTRESRSKKHVMITDLDESDVTFQNVEVQVKPILQPSMEAKVNKERKYRMSEKEKQLLCTMSGNFNRRSRSADCSLLEVNEEQQQNKSKSAVKLQRHFTELLLSKDRQMQQLLQRLTKLHEFNEQFSIENGKQQQQIHTLNTNIQQLRKKLSSCSRCKELDERLLEMNAENKTLETDIEMLKTLVFRLNVQIENYQNQLRHQSMNRNVGAGDAIDRPSSAPQPALSAQLTTQCADGNEWQTLSLRTHTLAPLLQAYDEMVCDKQQLLQQYATEFEQLTGQLKTIIEENQQHLKENEKLKQNVGSWREERIRLQAQLDVCRKKAEAQSKKSDLAKEKLLEVMHCYEQRLQTLMLDIEHLQSAYKRCKSELVTLKSLQSQPADAIVTSLEECKKLLAELKEKHSQEKRSLESTIEEMRELQNVKALQLQKLKGEHVQLKQDLELQSNHNEQLVERNRSLQNALDQVKQTRDRLKSRHRIALQWAKKLEEGHNSMQDTWDAIKRLETIVKHKEAQVRGLQSRHIQEMDKMQQRLTQKEETIRTILIGRLGTMKTMPTLPATSTAIQ